MGSWVRKRNIILTDTAHCFDKASIKFLIINTNDFSNFLNYFNLYSGYLFFSMHQFCVITLILDIINTEPSPVPDSEFKVNSTTLSSITVQWKESPNVPDEGTSYLKYVLEFRDYKDGLSASKTDNRTVQHKSGQVSYQATIDGLSPDTEYFIRLSPQYVKGVKVKYGEWTKWRQAKTKIRSR